MDPLSQFLDGPRAANAFALGVTMCAPWGMEVRDGAALTLVAVTAGHAVIGETRLDVGDIALVRGPEPYRVANDSATTPTIVIHPGQRCVSTTGEELQFSMAHGLRRWGNDSAGETRMIIGSYEREGELGRLALGALPRLAIVRSGQADSAVLALLEREIEADAVAQSALLDRLLDMLLITSVRAWLHENPPDRAASWLVANDSLVAGALALLHEAPERAWTVDSLARTLSVSRATLAARFRARVGRPPIAYLTDWRLSLASEYLSEQTATVAAVGRRVGYDSPYTFSAAFKRHFGQSPAQYRRDTANAPG